MVLKNLGFENTALGFLAGFTGNRIQDLLEEKESAPTLSAWKREFPELM